MEDKISVLIPQEELETRIREMAAQISKDYEGESLHLVCILRGSIFFTCELAKYITVPVTIDFMSVSSYGDGTESTGRIKIMKDLDDPIKDKNVLVVEDIIDSGNTLYHLKKMLNARQPASLNIVTLLDKPQRREVPMEPEYTGFVIEDEFVIGYGLDYDEEYRNLPYVGVLKRSVYEK
jgi:hypoxanthine phosphoribosyltransferase